MLRVPFRVLTIAIEPQLRRFQVARQVLKTVPWRRAHESFMDQPRYLCPHIGSGLRQGYSCRQLLLRALVFLRNGGKEPASRLTNGRQPRTGTLFQRLERLRTARQIVLRDEGAVGD